jgi:hypothetical protein
MKLLTTLLILLCAAFATAQESYITATGNVVFEAGSIEEFNAPTVFVSGSYENRTQSWVLTLGISTGVVSASSPILRSYSVRFSKSEIDAFTGTGSTDTETMQSALDQAVQDYLETLNPMSTVTIN